jgi:hypothetical protein
VVESQLCLIVLCSRDWTVPETATIPVLCRLIVTVYTYTSVLSHRYESLAFSNSCVVAVMSCHVCKPLPDRTSIKCNSLHLHNVLSHRLWVRIASGVADKETRVGADWLAGSVRCCLRTEWKNS